MLSYFPDIVRSNKDSIAFGHMMDNESPCVEVILKNPFSNTQSK